MFYLLGGMGGGDVKLMAGFGALLGVKRLLEAALWTAGCGGVMAVAVIVVSTLREAWRREIFRKGRQRSGPVPRCPVVDSIPYAPAIAAGCVAEFGAKDMTGRVLCIPVHMECRRERYGS